MGWERGHYYTRSRKVNGRVVREYVGAGRIGELAAQLNALDRSEREAAADCRRAIRAELEELELTLSDLNDQCDLLTRAALAVAGFRQHRRGEWRKQRVHKTEDGPALETAHGSDEPGRAAADPNRG